MMKAITDKLVATVVEVIDLDGLYSAWILKGRIGLDIRVERGLLSTGKTVLTRHELRYWQALLHHQP